MKEYEFWLTFEAIHVWCIDPELNRWLHKHRTESFLDEKPDENKQVEHGDIPLGWETCSEISRLCALLIWQKLLSKVLWCLNLWKTSQTTNVWLHLSCAASENQNKTEASRTAEWCCDLTVMWDYRERKTQFTSQSLQRAGNKAHSKEA